MKYTMSFQERAKLALEQLSKQSPVTLTMAKKQAQLLKTRSISKTRSRVVGILISNFITSHIPVPRFSNEFEELDPRF